MSLDKVFDFLASTVGIVIAPHFTVGIEVPVQHDWSGDLAEESVQFVIADGVARWEVNGAQAQVLVHVQADCYCLQGSVKLYWFMRHVITH